MKIRILVAWLLALGTTPALSSTVERPNIVLIISDDHGWPYHGFADSPKVFETNAGPMPANELSRTPNIDDLASTGALFRNGYTTASICRPSLRTLLSASGLYDLQWESRLGALEHGYVGDIPPRLEAPHYRTIPRELQRYGYHSWEGGKMWSGSFTDAGFTHGLAEQGFTDIFSIDGVLFGREGWDTAHCGSTGDAATCPALDPLREFLDTTEDSPFFLWVAPMLPHTPHDPPSEYRQELASLGLDTRHVNYLANVRWMDEFVGEVVHELEARDLRENTLIIYLSDNGWDLNFIGFSGGKGKGSPYDLGSRTPVIFSWPGRIPSGDYPELVLASDIPRTILSFANATDVPPESVGNDLRPRVEGGAAVPRDEIVQHYQGDTVLALPWRYIRHTDGSEELYAIEDDPFETIDLAADNPAIVAEYRMRAQAHREALLTPPAETEIVGRVSAGGVPVAAGQLRIGSRVLSTDSSGYFSSGPLPAGRYRLRGRGEISDLSSTFGTGRVDLPFSVGGVFLEMTSAAPPSPSSGAEGRLQGTVTNGTTAEPVSLTKVRLKCAGTRGALRTETGSRGTFFIEGLVATSCRMRAKARGFRARRFSVIEIPPGDTVTTIPIELTPALGN